MIKPVVTRSREELAMKVNLPEVRVQVSDIMILMTTTMISGLDLNKSIFYGIQKQTFHLVFQKIKLHKVNFIVLLVVPMLLEEKLWKDTLISV